jgi:hypothetical protein
MRYILLCCTFMQLFACQAKQPPKITIDDTANIEPNKKATSKPKKIKEIEPPAGYVLEEGEETSFSSYLLNISLNEDNTVYLFNGVEKRNQTAQFAVLDINIGDKDLQQCADAVMRLRAEYLFAQKRFKEMVFIDNDGKKYAFSAPYTRDNLDSFLWRVFGMCGSASLAKQLNPDYAIAISKG